MKIFLGYAFIALSALLVLALLSFNPLDSAILTSRINQPVENMAGIIGVWISSPLVLLYGRYGSLALSFGIFAVGINTLMGTKIGRIFIKATLFIISSISLSVIIAAAFAGATYIEAGLLGLAISKSLTEIIHPYIIIGIFSLVLLLCLSSAMKLFRSLTYGMARLMGLIILAPFRMFGLFYRGRDEIIERGDVLGEEFEVPGGFAREERRSEKEPEFLKKSVNPEGNDTVKRPDMGAPAWLYGEKGPGDVLSEINRYFDREVGDGDSDKHVMTENTGEIMPEPAGGEEEAAAVRTAASESGTAASGTAESAAERAAGPGVKVEEEADALATEGMASEVKGPVEAGAEVESGSAETAPEKDIKGIEEIEDAGEIEEIVGEADYRELSFSRLPEEGPSVLELFPEIEESPDYIFPDKNILEKGIETFSKEEENEEIERISKIIENTFASFKIEINVSGHSRGPAITRYEIIPPVGLKLRNIVNLTDDLALNLGTRNIRIVAPIGNKSIIGVEVPNKFRRTVVLRDIIESEEYLKTRAKLPLILGKDIAGNIVIEDLTEMPHLLIAGTTGSGKSVYVSSLIGGITFSRTADEVKFIFIDPKMVELELYNGIPHLLAPVITSPEEAIAVLEWTSAEMDKRYKLFSDFGVRNMQDYNREVKKIKAGISKKSVSDLDYFPYIVIVIDEFANLMLRLPKETEKVISRIAAMARAVGIHLVVATQRPSVDVVTGIIKANFPSRIAFRVSSQTDSRTILDKSGAEKLLGKGDMLFMTPNFIDMLRIQSPYISNNDVENLVRELKRNGTADYIIDPEELTANPVPDLDQDFSVNYRDDPLFPEGLKAAVENGEISASYLQRRFRIGYNRASRIIDAMDKLRILGPAVSASKPREVLIGTEEMNGILSGKQQ